MASTNWTDTSTDLIEMYMLDIDGGQATVQRSGTAGYAATIGTGWLAKEAKQTFRTAAEAQAWCERELTRSPQ